MYQADGSSTSPGAVPNWAAKALFTLGDRPETRWPGPVSGSASALRVDAGLCACHGDPGAEGDRSAAAPQPWRDELVGAVRLKPVAPSMGMMLETTSTAAFETRGQAHYGSP